MKKWFFLLVLIILAWLYGWRIHPQEILNYIPFRAGNSPYKNPIFVQESKKNLMARWHPQDLLDGFNGNREFNERQTRRQRPADENK